MGTEEEEKIKPLGARLAEQRELRKVSLDEISRVTKISIHLLHAMESDDWDALPGGIFTRNFIRLYADHLGLDAERWVEEFKQEVKQQPTEEVEEEETQKSDGPELSHSWLYLLLVVIILLLFGGYFAISRIGEAPPSVESRQLPVEPVKQPQKAVADPQTEGMELELTETAEGRTFWFMWWADGKLQNGPEGTRKATGEKIVLRAKERFTLLVNHYNSVDIVLNGKKLNWEELSPEAKTNADGVVTSYQIVINPDAPQ